MKTLRLCCALVAVALVLGSCAPTDAKNTKVELSLYMARDVTAPDAGMWDEMVASFQKDYPNVTLVPEFLSGEPYHQKLKTMAVAGTLPDLVWIWPGKRTNYITNQGLVHDLRPSLKGEEDKYAEIAMTPAGKNNELFHLADGVVVTTVLYTNNKLLKELGLTPAKTTDELIAQAKVIHAKGLVPVALSNRDAWEVQSCLVGTLLERFGGQKWYDDAVTNKAKFTDPAFVKAMALIKQLTDAKVFPEGINSMDYPESGEMFLQEKAVYYLDGSWKVNGLVTTLKPEQKDYISLEAFPDVPGQLGRSGSGSAVAGPGFGINKKLEGAKFDAALAWVKHYSGEKGSMIRLQKGAIPAYKLNLDGAKLDPMVVKLAEFIKTHPATNVLDDRMDGEGMGVLQPAIQMMMLGKKTPEAVAAEYEAWVAANDSSRK